MAEQVVGGKIAGQLASQIASQTRRRCQEGCRRLREVCVRVESDIELHNPALVRTKPSEANDR